MTQNKSVLFAAPHRLAFMSGSLGLAAIAIWWAVRLGAMHLDWPEPDPGNLPITLLHAPVLLLQVYPAFIFGFLLTVFPRWMGQQDLGPSQFGPVSAGIAVGLTSTAAGMWYGSNALVQIGFLTFSAAWAFGVIVLARVVRANCRTGKPTCWHAISALTALSVGLISAAFVSTFLIGGDPRLLRWGIVMGLNGFILPVFLTVAHRMVPFFAGSAVPGYQRWRPDWLLAVLWALLSLRMVGDLALLPLVSGTAAFGLSACTGLMAWKWWPRNPAPGLLRVLIWGFAWAPAGFGLSALATAGLQLGLAPVHVLTIGFAASLLVAMVTRVTQGHSGQALAMTGTAWLAFGAIQLATVLRVGAALRFENGTTLVAAALVLVGGLLPWLVRNALIYVHERSDGRPG